VKFEILPELRDYLKKNDPETIRMLEESLLSEGCRDDLVVWKEENALLDGHHRYEICESHGIPYRVRYLSLPDMHAAKIWMRKNQLSRRNMEKSERDQCIRELRAEGWTQKEIAEAVGVSKSTIIRSTKVSNATSENSDKSTPTENLEAIIAERVAEKEKAFEAERQRYQKELEATKKQTEPVIIEKEIVKPVVDPELEKRVKEKEAELDRRMAELDEEKEINNQAYESNLETLRENFAAHEKLLKKELQQKVAEIGEAAKAGLDVKQLSEEKQKLMIEIDTLKKDLDNEVRAEDIRKNFRKADEGIGHSLHILELIQDRILEDPVFCRLSVDELALTRDRLFYLGGTANRAMEKVNELIQKIQGGAGLHVIKNL
jgi:transcriptional regulator with XRE-family HTH domain